MANRYVIHTTKRTNNYFFFIGKISEGHFS